VKGLRNFVLLVDLIKISGAEEAPDEIVEEQRRLYNPENESAEDPADEVEEIRAPEGFGDMYEDALRELFLVYCELDGFNEIDDEIEASRFSVQRRKLDRRARLDEWRHRTGHDFEVEPSGV
jgi:hypothetical protein